MLCDEKWMKVIVYWARVQRTQDVKRSLNLIGKRKCDGINGFTRVYCTVPEICTVMQKKHKGVSTGHLISASNS